METALVRSIRQRRPRRIPLHRLSIVLIILAVLMKRTCVLARDFRRLIDPSIPKKCTSSSARCSCAPYRSPDYCRKEESFGLLTQKRTIAYRSNPDAAIAAGHWFQKLEDKNAAFLFSTEVGYAGPQIYCCLNPDVNYHINLTDCLMNNVPVNATGIVIKAAKMHSNQGVFVLTDKNSDGEYLDQLTGIRKTQLDVESELAFMQATKVLVEQFIGEPLSLPTEYKLHMFNGTVAAIDVVQGRGTNCQCYASMDTNWTRLDTNGCFESTGMYMEDDNGCPVIDWGTGGLKAGMLKKDLGLCIEPPPRPKDCAFEAMIETAQKLSSRLGVYMRIDMFIQNDMIYVNEYTPNPMNGLRHCSAKETDDGCIDPCFLGRMWRDSDPSDGFYGGPATPIPTLLVDYSTKSPSQQCDMLINALANRPSGCRRRRSRRRDRHRD